MVSLFISSSLLITLQFLPFLLASTNLSPSQPMKNPSHSEESYHIGTEEDMRLR